jgi:hypothetical protein
MLPTGIKNMKKFLTNRGVSIRSGTEKSELEALVQQHAETPLVSASAAGGGSSAPAQPAPQRNVRAILLASHHNSLKSSKQNVMVLQTLLEQHLEKNPGLTPEEVKVDFCRTTLLVSEGRGINTEYSMFGFKPPCVLKEFENDIQSEVEVIDRFLLWLEVFDAVSNGHDIGNGVAVSEEKNFLRERALNDGYRPMLSRIKETPAKGIAFFEEFLDIAFECKEKTKPVEAYEAKLQELFTAISQKYLAAKPELQAVVEGIRTAQDRNPLLKEAFERCRNLRDKAIFQKVRVRLAENPRINTVFVILGKAHYNNFKSLLESDPLFTFDSAVSSNSAPENTPSPSGGGGGKRKSRKRKARRPRTSRKTV